MKWGNLVKFDYIIFFFKQKTADEIGTGDWSSDVCSSDLYIYIYIYIYIYYSCNMPMITTYLLDNRQFSLDKNNNRILRSGYS